MKKIIIASLLAATLTGCATSHQPHGNFVLSESAQHPIATDAVKQLAALYPPAKTSFELKQAAVDEFGQTMISQMRERGYALYEYQPPIKGAKAAEALASETPKKAAGTLPLNYLLDQAGDSNLYRLTLTVGDSSITRPYLEQNGSFLPAGYWVRKE